MFLLAVLLVLLTGFVLSGIAGHYDARLRKHGPHALAFRWFFATANWAGKPVTNRGWNRPGTKALTPTGHAHRRWYLPGWQHALWRTRNTLARPAGGRWPAVPVPPHRGIPGRHGCRRGRYRRVAGPVMGAGARAPQELRQAAARPPRRRCGHPAGEQARVVAGDPPRPELCRADLAEGRAAAQVAGARHDRRNRCCHARDGEREADMAVHRAPPAAAPRPAGPAAAPGDLGGHPARPSSMPTWTP